MEDEVTLLDQFIRILPEYSYRSDEAIVGSVDGVDRAQ